MHDAASVWNAGFIRQGCNRRVLLPDKSGVPVVGHKVYPSMPLRNLLFQKLVPFWAGRNLI
jgi:hypothetical protein